MAGGEAERHHVLLRIAATLAEFTHFSTEGEEELCLICHESVVVLYEQINHEQISVVRGKRLNVGK
jgi:hypothetical protein